MTLSYVDQFNFPINKKEIYLRLLSLKNIKQRIKSKSIGLKELEKELLKLRRDKAVQHHKGYYLASKKSNNKKQRKENIKVLESYIVLRSKRKKISKVIESKLKKHLIYLCKIPFVEAIGITGNLAVESPNGVNDDIDLLVVTKANALWICRFFVLIYSLIFNRQYFGLKKKNYNVLCLNMWLDENSLTIAKGQRNVYRAYELCQARWVYDTSNIRMKIIKCNSWMSNILPHYYNHLMRETVGLKKENRKYYLNKKNPLNNVLLGLIGRIMQVLNLAFYLFQILFLVFKNKIPLAKIKINSAALHPRNSSCELVHKRWESSLNEIQL